MRSSVSVLEIMEPSSAQIPRTLPDVELQIYEKNPAFAGVWYENTFVTLSRLRSDER